jgi:Enhancer of polycomb-like
MKIKLVMMIMTLGVLMMSGCQQVNDLVNKPANTNTATNSNALANANANSKANSNTTANSNANANNQTSNTSAETNSLNNPILGTWKVSNQEGNYFILDDTYLKFIEKNQLAWKSPYRMDNDNLKFINIFQYSAAAKSLQLLTRHLIFRVLNLKKYQMIPN